MTVNTHDLSQSGPTLFSLFEKALLAAARQRMPVAVSYEDPGAVENVSKFLGRWRFTLPSSVAK